MAVHNVSYDIPTGKFLSCIACDKVLKNVTDAIDHTAECRKKLKLARKYEGQNEVEKNKGCVTWTQANVVFLLDVMKKNVKELGRAKAHYNTSESRKVHDRITSELASNIGPGITRYQMTRKWSFLQTRSLQYERSKKSLLKENLPVPDPPSFHPSVKEISRNIEEEKRKFIKEMEHSDKNYTIKIKDGHLAIPEELSFDRDEDIEFTKLPVIVPNEIPSNEGESGSMVLKRSNVLNILNKLEEGVGYAEIQKEFGITESVLMAIEQNGKVISQGSQRCSLCHVMLSTYEDVVAHEIECSRVHQQWKGDISLTSDKTDTFVGFLPETVQQLVDVVLDLYPKLTKGMDWNKVASQLSCMQSGVTPLRCSQKWHNLIAKCRKYQRLDDWAKKNNYSHTAPSPEFFDRLIPYAKCAAKTELSQDSIQKFLSIGPYVNKGSTSRTVNAKKRYLQNDSVCEGKEAIASRRNSSESDTDLSEDFRNANDLITDLEAIDTDSNEFIDFPADMKMTIDCHVSSSNLCTSEEELHTSSSSYENHAKQKKQQLVSSPKDTPIKRKKSQGHRIKQIETKLDDVLGILDDVLKENQRLTREQEMKQQIYSEENIADKLEKLTQVFVSAHNQNLRHLKKLTKMWETHHKEHQTLMRSMISELSSKRRTKTGKKRKNIS